MTATSLKFTALVTYPAYVLCLNATKRKRRYLINHQYTLLGCLPAGIVKLKIENGNLELDEIVSVYGSTSSDLVSVERFIPKIS